MLAREPSLFLVVGLALVSAPPSFAGPPLDRYGDPLPLGAVARLGTVRLGYDGQQESVALSPDGKLVATVDASAKGVQLWDSATGRPLHHFPVAGNYAPSLPVFSADGKRLAAVACIDLLVWDVTTRKEIRRFRAECCPTAGLVFCGATLAASCSDGRVRWWDIATGKTLRRWDCLARAGRGGRPLKGRVLPFASPDGRTVAGHVRIFPGKKGQPDAQPWDQYFIAAWDAVRGKELWRIKDVGAFAGPLSFSADGKWLSWAAGGGEVTVWETATGKRVRQFQGERFALAWTALSGDGRLLAAGWPGWSVWLWDVRSGKRLHRLEFHDRTSGKDPAPQVMLSADGKRLAVGTGVSVRLFDTASGRETPAFEGHRAALTAIAFSADGRSLLSTSGDTLCIWDTAGWKESQRGLPRSLSRLADRTLVLERGACLAEVEGNLCLFDLRSGKVRWRLPVPDAAGRRLLSGDGKVVVLVQGEDNGDCVRLLEVATGKELGRQEWLKKVAWLAAPHAGLVAWTSSDVLFGGYLHLWDGKGKVRVPEKDGTEQQQANWAGVGDNRLLFAPDGRHFAVAGTPRLPCAVGVPTLVPFAVLFEVAADRRPHGLGIPGAALGWAFSPDSRTLATTHAPGPNLGFLGISPRTMVCLWEVATGQLRATLAGHGRAVHCVAFAPDGRWLASGCEDGTILVWDLLRLPRPK